MVDQHRSRAAAARTTAPVVTSSLYEAAFSTLGRNPQAGIALARTEEQARQSLADMLVLCDPAASVTADIVEFTRARTVAHYTGTAGDLFAQFTTGAPARTVIARRLTSDTTTRPLGSGDVMCLTLANATAIIDHHPSLRLAGRGYTRTWHHARQFSPGDLWRPDPDRDPHTVTDRGAPHPGPENPHRPGHPCECSNYLVLAHIP